jgi:hypothetical protein
MTTMNIIWAILVGTPPWVFVLFALLVGLGIQQLRPRTVHLARIFIVPAVFLAWGLFALWMRAAIVQSAVPAWLSALTIGFAGAWATTRLDGLGADRQRGLIHLPGGWTTLVVSMMVFAAKYMLAVSIVMRPDWRDVLATADMAVSGLSTGFFLARLARMLRHYRNAPQAELAAVSP